MMIVYDKSFENVTTGSTVDINMDNINKILVTNDVANVNTTLTKTFNNTGWNSFFVPFDFTLTADMLNDFDFATLYATTLKNGNGSPIIAFIEAKAGDKLKAYFPCLIKAKATGKYSLNVRSVSYKPSAGVAPADCSSTTELYTFYPVMENTYIAEKNGYYLNSEKNGFVYNENPEAYIPPFTFYMTIQNKTGNSYILPTSGSTSETKFAVIGFDEATGITNIEGNAGLETGKVYNLQGVVVGDSVEGLPKGVYIMNGRKVIVK